jgi:hypothetical protein
MSVTSVLEHRQGVSCTVTSGRLSAPTALLQCTRRGVVWGAVRSMRLWMMHPQLQLQLGRTAAVQARSPSSSGNSSSACQLSSAQLT